MTKRNAPNQFAVELCKRCVQALKEQSITYDQLENFANAESDVIWNGTTIWRQLNGKVATGPAAELVLFVHRITGVTLDWLYGVPGASKYVSVADEAAVDDIDQELDTIISTENDDILIWIFRRVRTAQPKLLASFLQSTFMRVHNLLDDVRAMIRSQQIQKELYHSQPHPPPAAFAEDKSEYKKK